jgi:hypothetical protein
MRQSSQQQVLENKALVFVSLRASTARPEPTLIPQTANLPPTTHRSYFLGVSFATSRLRAAICRRVFRRIRLYEVHKFILLSGHTYSVGALGINNAFYIQLSDAERAAVDAAAKAIAREAAEAAAVRAFNLTDEQRSRLVVRERG